MYLLSLFLRKIVRNGRLVVVDHDGQSYEFGTSAPDHPDVTIRFTDAKAARFVALNPRLGAGEAFMDGRLVIEQGDIMGLIGLIRGNNAWDHGGVALERPGFFKAAFKTIGKRVDQINNPLKSQANVAHHYDLTDEFYALFLDADQQYSCAYFTDTGNSLEQAQADKKAHIAAKLALQPGHRVLDIGCGWGGMALYLHAQTGVDVLGITLSENQLAIARRRAADAGVDAHVKFELIDYRKLEGQFDRIVSVGMFEHVGTPHYHEFFRQCTTLLANGGVMLLHTIGRLGGAGTTDAFTQKYIFPGGYIPALSEIVSVSEAYRLIATDVETLRLHYAMTIRHWYDRVIAHKAEVEAMYDARFYRMWIFYLAGAVAAFEHGGMGNYQIQFARSRHALPITRDYIHDGELTMRPRAPVA